MVKAPSSKSGLKKAKAIKGDTGKDFRALSDRLASVVPVAYRMTESYKNDDVIEHSIFGRGIVLNVSSQKMEVLFADGSRVLAMDRKSA